MKSASPTPYASPVWNLSCKKFLINCKAFQIMVTVHVKSHCICIFRGAIPILGELDSFTFLVLYRLEYRHLKELLVSFFSRLSCSFVKTLEVLSEAVVFCFTGRHIWNHDEQQPRGRCRGARIHPQELRGGKKSPADPEIERDWITTIPAH